VIPLRPIETVNLQDALFQTLLKAGPLLPVDTQRWQWVDLHNAYRNADEHLMLCAILDRENIGPEVLETINRLEKLCAKIRRDVMMVLLWRKVPLAETAVDGYRKAVATNYLAMVEAGSVLVSASGVPQHAGLDLYRSLCTA
jgi:hypothetical protein